MFASINIQDKHTGIQDTHTTQMVTTMIDFTGPMGKDVYKKICILVVCQHGNKMLIDKVPDLPAGFPLSKEDVAKCGHSHHGGRDRPLVLPSMMTVVKLS